MAALPSNDANTSSLVAKGKDVVQEKKKEVKSQQGLKEEKMVKEKAATNKR